MQPVDPILAAAFWTGIAALLLTLALGQQIVRLRVGRLCGHGSARAALDERATIRPHRVHRSSLGYNASLPILQFCQTRCILSVKIRNNVRVGGNGSATMVFAHGFGCDQTMWRFLT